MTQKLEKALVLLFVFLFPTQLALHFWPSWAFVFGIRVDYLAPAVYLTDVIAVALLIFGFKEIVKYKTYLIWLLVFSLVNIIFSISPAVSLFKWLKVFEFIGLGIYFVKKINTNTWKDIYQTLFLSLIFFSLIGIDQFLLGHTINGPLYLLGERAFAISTPGIALNTFFGKQVLRAYSTFPHPNALAGYLGASTLFLYTVGFFNKKNKKIFGLLIIIICFLLTSSLTAFLAITIVVVLKKYSSKLFVPIVLLSLIMPIVSERILSGVNLSKNIFERLNLSIVAGKLSGQNFWLGTGLNTFTIAMTKIKPTLTFSWLLQPVHNIFLLVLSEVGIFGLLLLVFYLYKTTKVFPIIFIFVIITGFFDHYWADSQQNLLLLVLISAKLTTWKS